MYTGERLLFSGTLDCKDNTISSDRRMKYQDVAPVKLYTADAKRNEYRSPHKVTLVSLILTKSEKAQQFVMNSLGIKFKDIVNAF